MTCVQGVAMCHAFTDLLHNETWFAFWQATFCAQVIQQGSVFCQFQVKETVPANLHYLEHRHDVGMRRFEQDFYFAQQKVGQVALGHFFLVYHFQGNTCINTIPLSLSLPTVSVTLFIRSGREASTTFV